MSVLDLINFSSGLTWVGFVWLLALIGLFLFVAWISSVLVRLLKQRGIVDVPNARSSHHAVIPRGGGLAVLVGLLPLWGIIALTTSDSTVPPSFFVACGAFLLAGVSFVDDIRGLSAGLRLAAQCLTVSGLLILDPFSGLVFPPFLLTWLPDWVEPLFCFLAWIWFINLFNFMDGIDGITGLETIHIGVGLAILAMLAPWFGKPDLGASFFLFGLAAAAAASGFLVQNWPPARIFLGDVGSVPLGFLLGWLLLELAARGYHTAAVILPAYYLIDSSVTLLIRIRLGQYPWRAHRNHFYQRAAQGGLGHAGMIYYMIGVNIFLLICAVASFYWSFLICLGGAGLGMYCFFVFLQRHSAPIT